MNDEDPIPMAINLTTYIIKNRLSIIDRGTYRLLIDAYKISAEPKERSFIDKWDDIYWNRDGNNHVSAWLFHMWSDAICRSSRSNLSGKICYPLLMLISGLNNSIITNISDLKASIINSYKPYLISLCTLTINIIIKIR
jgi:hypothetical protein